MKLEKKIAVKQNTQHNSRSTLYPLKHNIFERKHSMLNINEICFVLITIVKENIEHIAQSLV